MADSPALTPPAGHPRFPLMDSLRGLAAVAVVLVHAYGSIGANSPGHPGDWDWLVTSLRAAVQVFFALSGFLLVRPYLAARLRGAPAPSAREFWRRRVLRIVPAYWVALTVIAITIPAAAPDTFGSHWWRLYGFLQSYSTDTTPRGLPVAWSLTAEASFYLLIPALALLIRRAGVWPVVAGMVLGGLGVQIATAVSGDHSVFRLLIAGFPGQAPFFAIGIALAAWSVGDTPRWLAAAAARPGRTWLAAAGLFVAMAAVLGGAPLIGSLSDPVRGVGFSVVCLPVIALLLLPVAFERAGVVQRWLSRPSLVFTGMVSYSLYLWHAALIYHLFDHGFGQLQDGWPLAARLLLTFSVVMAGSLVTAYVSYLAVELPFLRLKERRVKATLMGRPRESTGAA